MGSAPRAQEPLSPVGQVAAWTGVVGGGGMAAVSALHLVGAELGNVAEWAVVGLTGVAGVVAYRALRLQQRADLRRDAEVRRRDEDERRRQASRVWIISIDKRQPGRTMVDFRNGSDAPVFDVTADWDDASRQQLVPPEAARVDPDQETWVVLDNGDPDLDESTVWIEFSDANGVRWQRRASGALTEVSEGA